MTRSRAHAHRRKTSKKTKVVLVLGVLVIAVAVSLFLVENGSNPSNSASTTSSTTAPTIAPTPSTNGSSPSTTTVPPVSTSTTQIAQTTTTVATVPTSEVTIEVFNGIGTPNVAATAAKALVAQGFVVNGTGDAARFTYSETTIKYPLGMEASAMTIARHLVGATSLVADRALSGTVIDVVLGASYNGVTAG